MTNWLKNPPKDKIEIVHADDWDYICINGENVHWHDSLGASELLSRMGFEVHTYCV